MARGIEHYKNIISDWIENERRQTTGSQAAAFYLSENKKRYDYMLRLCKSLKPDPQTKVLDIGRHFLTFKLAEYYKDVTTLGFEAETSLECPEYDDKCRHIPNIVLDLNKAKYADLWPRGVSFDLIVYAETMEHLYESPEFTLLMFEYLLNPDGLLICTTPNGASVIKRIKCIMGKNVQEKMHLYSQNPGHYREYIKDELIEMGNKAGFEMVKHIYLDYQHSGNIFKRIIKSILSIVPSFRQYQIIIFKKSEQSNK